VINAVFHFTGGMALALVMNQKLRFKNIYRSLIVIPWAIPGVIVGLTWKQEFHAQYGFVNVLITGLGGQPISWLDDPAAAFIAVLFVNIWLGIPFYMVMLLGGLQSISLDYYEAAQMDGASAWNRFRYITMRC
jgi:arabinogalactan oligomer/maltooligosaccharide transport system permease protein